MSIHPLHRTLVALALLPALSAVASAAPDDSRWSDALDRPGASGTVFATFPWNGDLVVGGKEFHTDGQVIDHVARFDGVAWHPVGEGFAEDVRAFAVFQNELIAAGDFNATSTLAPANGVARFDGVSWQPLGQGLELSWAFEPEIWDLEVYQGELYAAGVFDRAGGKPVTGIARWDGAQWRDVAGSVAGAYQPRVCALEVWNGLLYAAGRFDTAGGKPCEDIATWNGTSWSPVGAGLPGPLTQQVLEIKPFQGRLYAGGTMHEPLWVFENGAWSIVPGGIPDWSISSYVHSLEVYQDRLYVGGTFRQAGNVQSSAVARFDGAGWESIGGIEGDDFYTIPYDMTVWNDLLVIGGEFAYGMDTFGYAPGNGVTSYDVIGYDGMDWQALGQGLGSSDEIRELVHWNGGVVAVGSFVTIGDQIATSVAWFDGNGWHPLGTFDFGVRDAVVFQGDLVVTGYFNTVDGKPIKRVARYDGVQWSALGQGFGGEALAVYQNELYAGGDGGVRRWNGSSWATPGGTLLSGTVYVMQEYQNRLYIGGTINQFGGPGPNLVAWDGQTVAGVGGGTDKSVESMVVFQNQLLVGGRFTQAGGASANILAAWNGSSFSAFGNLTGSLVKAMEVMAGELYVAGDLAPFIGNPMDYLAKWNGSSFEALGSGLSGVPFSLLADDASGDLWVGGNFHVAGGKPSEYLARWKVNEAWTNLGFGLAGSAGTPSLHGGGDLSPSSPVTLTLQGALPNAPAALVLGTQRVDLPFLGGTLVPAAQVMAFLPIGGQGGFALSATMPATAASGASIHLQAWIADPAGPQGYSASNALEGLLP